MPYTVSTPRRFDFQRTLWGMTGKQWLYLGVGIAVAGTIGLGGVFPDLALGWRILLALVVMAPAAALAYVKYRGLGLDRALWIWVKFGLSSHRSVWRKGFGEILIDEGLVEPDAPLVAVDRGAVLAMVVVLLNLLVVTILVGATWYMIADGFEELSNWVR